MKEIRYYNDYTDDFCKTKHQEYQVTKDYEWLKKDLCFRFFASLVYAVALFAGMIYCKAFLHIRFKDRALLRKARKTGAFVYCNHTQPVGDVFLPALACFPGRIHTIVSPANLGIPIVGKLLPYLGALPLPSSFGGMKKLEEAIAYRLEQKRYIVIYPEAHVWEYYTGIRPFPRTSFQYPAKWKKPVYCMTVTYRKRRFGRRPAAVVFVDGPFFPDSCFLQDSPLNIRRQAEILRETVYCCMVERSKNSNDAYIPYEPAAVKKQDIDSG